MVKILKRSFRTTKQELSATEGDGIWVGTQRLGALNSVKMPVSDKKGVAGAHPDRASLIKSDKVTLTLRHGSSNEVGHPDALGN